VEGNVVDGKGGLFGIYETLCVWERKRLRPVFSPQINVKSWVIVGEGLFRTTILLPSDKSP
jgi:hypothetical protein